ncbi:TPA: hypothetical protein U2Q68_005089 [Citrobacter amalonaticus]|uniref:hypothetical protein n=1 Tax=Citrobacter amalonaticus TaxID=35703 RepID=UPI00156228F5|nr:hypothetical protein [Citrobacter amalonaticus]HCB1863077.1 hypothetical protein [Citrobacter amalonaticus]HCB1890345.1 hypothetical protein [Citrobacter amalonaticus]HCB1912300.1 hypothetical protein [Citrobacter amalonaticus]HEM8615224.1 hypothetical protein [Citrobacter amalonaticus]
MGKVDYQVAIDLLRKRAGEELAQGYKAHYNALTYAANVLENELAFGREANHES